MKQACLYTLLVISFFLLAGCWDQRLVKDINLIYSQALDQTENGLIETTIVTIGGSQNESGASIGTSQTPAVISAIGNTPRDSRIHLDRKVSGELYASKNRVTLLSRTLAEQNIYSMLDVHYRSPISTTNARIAVVDGPAKNALHVKTAETPLISDYLGDLLLGLEETGVVPKTSLEYSLSHLFDNGADFALPLLNVIDHENVVFSGLALFNDKQMTGELDANQTLRLLLLDGKFNKHPRLNVRVNNDEKIHANNFVTVDVVGRDHNMDIIKTGDREFKADLNVSVTLNVVEYPKDSLYVEEHVLELNKHIETQLKSESEKVIQTLQEANCDYFGIGKHVRAFHYTDWQEMNWKQAYPDMPISVKLDTEIIYHGIVN